MNNTQYIGIRGHRGSGKNTVAYLLGNTIQFIIDNYMTHMGLVMKYASQLLQDPVFSVTYKVWCDAIKADETGSIEEMDARNVYFDSFGDTPRILLQLITNIPNDYFNSDYYKDHIIVNLKDFSWKIEDSDLVLLSLADAETVIKGVDREGFDCSHIYLSLREFIIYFAKVCMKYLGNDVWVKSMRCSENKGYDDYYNVGTVYKIFRDIKAPSELTYVKDHNGIIIEVERPAFKKSDKGVESLDGDERRDYKLTIKEDISTDEQLKKDIVNIALEIILKNNEK